jgi:mycothiol system anti-sigma-R factor
MICDEVKRVVYFFLDGSLGEGKLLEYTTHLEICHDCDERTTVSRKLRNFVRKRLTPMNAPDHLKVRLTESIRMVSAD